MLEVEFKQPGHFIQYLTSISGSQGSVISNPSTLQELGRIPRMSRKEVEDEILRSERAFQIWRKTPAKDRGLRLHRLAGLVRERREELAYLLTLEQGKSIREARGELDYGASYLDWFAGEATRVYGDIIPAPSDNKRIFVKKEPVGVVGMITPWNFPHAMIARKMAAALAAGCTALCKPAPETPYSAFALQALCREAGIPEGVFTVVTGEASEIGDALMSSPTVKKLSFTGSTATGKLLIQQSAATVKKLTLELGGNAPFLALEDADLNAAVEGALFAKFRNSGQTCVSVNRFLVQESIAEEFIRRFCEGAGELKVGDGLDETTDIGPLISERAMRKVKEFVEDAINQGARLHLGPTSLSDSRFIPPIVLSGLTDSMKIWNEEVFGPVAAFRTFSTVDDGIALANQTEAGLVSYLYTSSSVDIFRVSEALESGMVGVNDTRISIAEVPFGGVKQSGFGREGGRYGIDEYLNLKYLSVGL